MAEENKNIKGKINKLEIYHADAYQIAVSKGFKGTVEEWLDSLSRPAKEAAEYSNAEEAKRQSEETKRQAAETERASQEKTRISNENTRKSNETTRTANESARVNAENARAAQFQAWADSIGDLPNYDARISRNDKRLTNLEQGLPDDNFMVDESVAYAKGVPANALPFAEVHKVGGMTYRDETTNTLRHIKVTEVESVGANLFSVGDLVINETALITLQKPLQAGVYTLSANALSTDTDADYCLVTFIAGGANNANVYGSLKHNTVTKFTFTLETTVTTIRINASDNLANSVGDTAKITSLMLNKGATALPYSPYQEGTLPIPEAVQALDGYGWGVNESVYNYIDWDKKQFVKCIGVVDMGTLDWKLGNNSVFYAMIADKASGYNLLQPLYETIHRGGINSMPDKSVSVNDVYDFIYVRDTSYTDTETIKQTMQGVMLAYELAEPIVTNISDLITADNMLGVDGNGMLTFVNEHGKAVPSTVEYQLEV